MLPYGVGQIADCHNIYFQHHSWIAPLPTEQISDSLAVAAKYALQLLYYDDVQYKVARNSVPHAPRQDLQTFPSLSYEIQEKNCITGTGIENNVSPCGGILYVFMSIEFQKWGLPTCSVLLKYHKDLHYSC